LVEDVAEAVVIGDLSHEYRRDKLDLAFESLVNGAEYVALQRNRIYMFNGRPRLDAGFWVAGLSYCAQREPVVVGKPSSHAYMVAARQLGLPPADIAMVGDSVEIDLIGAASTGMMTILIDTWRLHPAGSPLIAGAMRFDNLLAYARYLAHF